MGVKFKNNASSTLDTAISNSDVGLSVAYGDGTEFPTLGVGDYFYMTIEDTDGVYEIVKVTARSGDAMTIVRAQEGTTATAFAAGALCELRVTVQGLLDKVAEDNLAAGSVTLAKLADLTTHRLIGRNTGYAGVPEEVSVSNMLDWYSTSQGSLIYRGAFGWGALAHGTAGQILTSGGAGADPSWSSGVLVSDGDKGDITVSATGATWTIDAGAVSLSKMANINQYEIIGRSSASAGVPQVIASSANVFSILGAANYAAIRTLLGMGTIYSQDSNNVSITGGTIDGISALEGTMKLGTNLTGTLALADKNCFIPMTGDITIPNSVFSARHAFIFYAGSSARQLIAGSGVTMRLGGSSSTGTRSLAAYTLAVGVMIDASTIVVSGDGVT